MKNVRFILFFTLALSLTLGTYSCKKDSTKPGQNKNGLPNKDEEDDGSFPGTKSYKITFSGQDLEERFSGADSYRYGFMLDSNLSFKVQEYLSDLTWPWIDKDLYLTLNGTKTDSLGWLTFTFDPTPGEAEFEAANRKGGPNNEHTVKVLLVQTGVGYSYVQIDDKEYPSLGIENFYDPNGQYELELVYYKD